MAKPGMTVLAEFANKWERKLPGIVYMVRALSTLIAWQGTPLETIADTVEDGINQFGKGSREEALADWASVCEQLPKSVADAGTDGR